jgi:hypothetical protein
MAVFGPPGGVGEEGRPEDVPRGELTGEEGRGDDFCADCQSVVRSFCNDLRTMVEEQGKGEGDCD